MELALQKQKVLSLSGEWLQKTPEQLEILAMRAQLEESKKSKQRPARTKDDKDKRDGKADKHIPTWKTVAPKDGESHEMTRNGKNYVYCPHHGDVKWVLAVNRQGVVHKTGCRKAHAPAQGGVSSPTALPSVAPAPAPAPAASAPKRRQPTKEERVYARALATVMMENGAGDEEPEEEE